MTPLRLLASPAGLTILAVTVGYGLACWVAPFTRCRRCHTTGRRRTLTGTIRACRPCRGTGARLRRGRWAFNHLANRAHAAHDRKPPR